MSKVQKTELLILYERLVHGRGRGPCWWISRGGSTCVTGRHAECIMAPDITRLPKAPAQGLFHSSIILFFPDLGWSAAGGGGALLLVQIPSPTNSRVVSGSGECENGTADRVRRFTPQYSWAQVRSNDRLKRFSLCKGLMIRSEFIPP